MSGCQCELCTIVRGFTAARQAGAWQAAEDAFDALFELAGGWEMEAAARFDAATDKETARRIRRRTFWWGFRHMFASHEQGREAVRRIVREEVNAAIGSPHVS